MSLSSVSGAHSISPLISGAHAKLNGAPSSIVAVFEVAADGFDGSEGRNKRSKVLRWIVVYFAAAFLTLLTRGMLMEYRSASGFQFEMR